MFWLSLWLPHRIAQQESAWLKELAGVERAPEFPMPHALWSARYWRNASTQKLFWISVIGSPVIILAFDHTFADTPANSAMIFFGVMMFGLAITDQYSQYLPDDLTLSLMWIGMLLQLSTATQTIGIEASVAGAATGYLLLWVAAKSFLILRKQEGLGHGDMKLLAAAGAWLGPLALPIAVLIGSGLAVLYQGTKLIMKKSGRNDLFAFGPWLALGIIAAALLGQ